MHTLSNNAAKALLNEIKETPEEMLHTVASTSNMEKEMFESMTRNNMANISDDDIPGDTQINEDQLKPSDGNTVKPAPEGVQQFLLSELLPAEITVELIDGLGGGGTKHFLKWRGIPVNDSQVYASAKQKSTLIKATQNLFDTIKVDTKNPLAMFVIALFGVYGTNATLAYMDHRLNSGNIEPDKPQAAKRGRKPRNTANTNSSPLSPYAPNPKNLA